jgi:NACHT domain
MTSQLSTLKQTDAVPLLAPLPPPIWLYILLSILSIAGVSLAFCILGKPDWPSLLMNLSSGMITSVVLLVVVDRRLRQSEVRLVLEFPMRVNLSLLRIFSPSYKLRFRYAQRHLAAVELQLSRSKVIDRLGLSEIEKAVLRGVNIVAGPGMGKTTLLQMIAAKQARKLLQGEKTVPITVLFPLRNWRTDTPLLAELFTHTAAFLEKPLSEAKKLLQLSGLVIMLDGFDEVRELQRPFEQELAELITHNASAVITISARSRGVIPMQGKEVVILPDLSLEELERIRDNASNLWNLFADFKMKRSYVSPSD